MELYLIRHTRPKIPSGICYGQSNVGLSDDYLLRLNELKIQFCEEKISKIYSSSLSRCSRLASELFTDKPIIDDRLMELNFGLWEMRPWAEIAQTELDDWAENLPTFTPPNGESLLALNERVLAFYQELIHSNLDKVAIVSHGGVIRCLLSHIMNIPLTAHLNWQIDYGSVSKIIVEDQFVRLSYSNKLH